MNQMSKKDCQKVNQKLPFLDGQQAVETDMSNLTYWEQNNSDLVEREVSQAIWSTLECSIFPGAKRASIILAIDYCQARGLDVLQKPVHIVPMQVKTNGSGYDKDDYVWRDVVMPGIGLYRIQAARAGNFAGIDEPEFGPDVTVEFTYTPKPKNQNGRYGRNGRGNQAEQPKSVKYTVTFPSWCKVTVYKMIDGQRCAFTAKEFWTENAATLSGSDCPNTMWRKRPHGQIAKCAEAQALRKAWPEFLSGPTAEEMEGKVLEVEERDITPTDADERKANGPQPLEKVEEQAPIEGEYQAADEQQGKTSNSRKKTQADKKPADDTKGPRLSPQQIKLIRARTAINQVSNEELLLHFKADCFESLPASRVNEILDYANKKAA